jgi:hypothetical protein
MSLQVSLGGGNEGAEGCSTVVWKGKALMWVTAGFPDPGLFSIFPVGAGSFALVVRPPAYALSKPNSIQSNPPKLI